MFGNVTWRDILMPQYVIKQLLITYKAADGSKYFIMKGQRVNFVMAVHYARFCLNESNPNPSKWTKAEYYKLEMSMRLQPDPFAAAARVLTPGAAAPGAATASTPSTSLSPSILLSHFIKSKPTGYSNLPPFKQNKQWIPWKRKVRLQFKADWCERIVDPSFDTKTLVDGNDKELWKQQSNYVLLLFNTHIQAPLGIMIRDQEAVKDHPHLIWQQLIDFYEDSALAQANASLIGVSLTQLRTSQFNTRMDFLAKFLGEINCFNEFSDEKMSSSTCVLYLNIAILEDKVLNSEVARIKTDAQRSNNKKTKAGKTKAVKKVRKFETLIRQFIEADIQLDGAKMLSRGAAAKAQKAKRNVFHNHINFDMYHPNTMHEQVNNGTNDYDATDTNNELDTYFDLIDIEHYDDSMLQEYAAYQRQC